MSSLLVSSPLELGVLVDVDGQSAEIRKEVGDGVEQQVEVDGQRRVESLQEVVHVVELAVDQLQPNRLVLLENELVVRQRVLRVWSGLPRKFPYLIRLKFDSSFLRLKFSRRTLSLKSFFSANSLPLGMLSKR